VQQIGRYQVLGELGRGAMGIVYRAQDPAIGRTIAIKSIRLQDLTGESERERLRERLFREAQAAGILSHPNIVTIYDIAEQDGVAYIFMEFVNGPPLEKMLIGEHPPDGETLLSIFRQTAGALDYAHKKGIVHRDIKPANIMVHEDGTAKITDFGVAKIVSQDLTRPGTMMGTPSYMSPEQVQGSGVSGKSDQFSLAVIAYEVLTGEKPFSAEYMPTLLYKIVREEPVSPLRLNPTLSPAVETTLQKAMSKVPEDRYPTCAAFIAALASACNSSLGWVPMGRGVSQNMPTVGSAEGITAPGATTLGQQGQATMQRTIPPEPATPPPLISQPPPLTETPPPFTPQPRMAAPVIADPLRREVQPSGHLVRNVMVIAVLVVGLGVAGILYTRNKPAAPAPEPTPPVEATAPPSSPPPVAAATPPVVETPPPAPAPTPPPPEDVDQEKEQEKPKETAKKEKAPPVERPAKTVGDVAARLPIDGVFYLTTSPAGATAVFDADPGLRCSTPCKITLVTGRHTFLLRKEGYRDIQRVIEVPRDPGLILDMTALMGTLNLITRPPGLTVTIDGKEQARKTPLSVTLPVGDHKVRVAHGNDPQEFSVKIDDGVLVQRTLQWSE
jgi:serine/threonine protein kinase